jgi:DUF1009 family protein
MQSYSGHLFDLGGMPDSCREELYNDGYEPIPEDLRRAANKKLSGQKEATVSLTSGGKLSKWASKQRKAKRKMAQASRRGNR